jgi:hypothetical protein
LLLQHLLLCTIMYLLCNRISWSNLRISLDKFSKVFEIRGFVSEN